MARKAVFLDRDGVINAYAYDPEFGTFDSPAHPGQFTLLPGVAKGVARLNEEGFLVIVVSNQPGLAKGHFTVELLEAITNKMKGLVQEAGGKLDAVYYCPHHPAGSVENYRVQCDCRKPSAGLFYQAAREWDIDLQHSYTVGDGVVDVLAGQRAGTKTVLVSPRKCYICSELGERCVWPDWVAENLMEAVDLIHKAENDYQAQLSNGEASRPCLW